MKKEKSFGKYYCNTYTFAWSENGAACNNTPCSHINCSGIPRGTNTFCWPYYTLENITTKYARTFSCNELFGWQWERVSYCMILLHSIKVAKKFRFFFQVKVLIIFFKKAQTRRQCNSKVSVTEKAAVLIPDYTS